MTSAELAKRDLHAHMDACTQGCDAPMVVCEEGRRLEEIVVAWIDLTMPAPR
jgi:hypothetical protein